jgi:hypothetical protein
MNFSDEWKVLILQRWAGEFPPALRDEADIVLKSSQDIADDLSGAGNFTADEVSAFMAVNGYGIVFDAGYPKWIIKMNKQLIIEK